MVQIPCDMQEFSSNNTEGNTEKNPTALREVSHKTCVQWRNQLATCQHKIQTGDHQRVWVEMIHIDLPCLAVGIAFAGGSE